jgi:SAM-dependent MidA family methyltransferase
MESSPLSVSDALCAQIGQAIKQAGGWLPFDAFMHAALYSPGLGYYAHGSQKFGALPSSGSDFITAPEMSPLFGACVGEQVAQALQASGTRCVYEFGAGTGAMALQICELLPQSSIDLEHYFIIEVSASLRSRQQEKLAHLGSLVQWLDALPEQIEGVIVGNEVLDAMPVKLLARRQGVWHERGVAMLTEPLGGGDIGNQQTPPALPSDSGSNTVSSPSSVTIFVWQDRPTALRPSCDIAGSHDYLTEIHPQAEAFVRTIAQHLVRGAAFFIDYGFPESEYYHPQRHMGTLMCHYRHMADTDPLDKVGLKDITAHVNFTGIALAGQDAGLDVLGYCNQGRFLMNCGLLLKMELLPHLNRGLAAKLATEHEMGELFKVIGFGKGVDFEPLGFSDGDRSHTL